MKKFLVLLPVIVLLFFAVNVFAVEAPLYFGDEKYPVKQNTLLLDSDDTTGDILIQFGNALNKIFQWDNDATDIGGDATGMFVMQEGLELYENTAGVGAGTGFTISQAGTGDSILQFLLNSVQRWVIGIDNSDSDKFKIASSADLNSDVRLTIDTSGNVGIGTTTPGSALDMKGTLRLSGATSGYVGLSPAAAAGSTTYTLPSADGTSGQVLSTSGTGILSWNTDISAIDYNFAYDTTNQAVTTAGTFQTITFDNATSVNNAWTYSAGDFTCPSTGLYLVQYTAHVGRNTNGDVTVTIRATKGGAEVPGSAAFASPSRGNRPIPLNNSFIMNATAGDLIRFQLTSSATGNSIGLFVLNAYGTTQPSITVTITRIK